MTSQSVTLLVCFAAMAAAQPAQPGQVRQPGQLPSPTQLPKPVDIQPVAPSAPGAEDDAIFRITTKYVLAPVIVTDKDGHFVNGLTPLDFQLFDNGKPQRISEDVATHPISLVVAIQASAETEQLLPAGNKIGNLLAILVK